jgi:hypothetical protein
VLLLQSCDHPALQPVHILHVPVQGHTVFSISEKINDIHYIYYAEGTRLLAR